MLPLSLLILDNLPKVQPWYIFSPIFGIAICRYVLMQGHLGGRYGLALLAGKCFVLLLVEHWQ